MTMIDVEFEEPKMLIGGEHPEDEEFENGFFIEPIAFAAVTQNMPIAQEEIFGTEVER